MKSKTGSKPGAAGAAAAESTGVLATALATASASDVESDVERDTADAADTAPEWRRMAVDRTLHGQRLDRLLVALAPEFSRSHLQGLIERGHVRLDGAVASSASRKVRFGQVVGLELVPTAESLAFRAEAVPLDIVYEDEHLSVINKPAGLVVHPAPGNWSGTLLNGLLAHHPAAAGLARAGIVHRLDKDTSGLMVVGRTQAAVTALSRAIAAREVQREYLALAHGVLTAGSRRVEAPIGRDPASRIRMAVVRGGRESATDVDTVAVHDGISALRCRLHTGRTHQIRVHLMHLGHPLVADAVYGGRPALGLLRQALHAHRLGFDHPATAAPMAFECPPPVDFAAAWARVVDAGRSA